MSYLLRITALLAAFTAAGCISDTDVVQTRPVVETSAVATESSSPYSEMHAAIPADRSQDKFFEYN
jgi:hypothetical protein